MMIDVVIPIKNELNKELIDSLKKMPEINKIIVTKEKPLSIARKNAVLKAQTFWVGMIDNDMILPKNWIKIVSSHITKKTGAIATVALQSNEHVQAYDKIVSTLRKLNKIDTSPHINNIIVRRDLIQNYNPPPLFFGEDQYLKKYIESIGYIWKVIPFVGVMHLGTSENHVIVGIFYKRHSHYNLFQFLRRILARLILCPFASILNLSLRTYIYLNKINVQFVAGWLKEWI